MDVLSTAVALRQGDAHQERFRLMKRRLNELRFGNDAEAGKQ